MPLRCLDRRFALCLDGWLVIGDSEFRAVEVCAVEIRAVEVRAVEVRAVGVRGFVPWRFVPLICLG